MPLQIPAAPAAAEHGVLLALQPDAAPRTARQRPAFRGTPRPARPLPLHRLDPVTGPAQPPATRLTGWQFLLDDDGGAVGAAEAALTPDGWVFSHFSSGPFTASTERALLLAESLPAAYQPRLLSVPDLYMMTLWLHADPAADPAAGGLGPDDLLMPLAPAPPGIAPHRPVRPGLLLERLTRRLAVGLAS